MEHMGDRSSAEKDLAELREDLDALQHQGVEQLRRFIDEKPEAFITMVCEGMLGVESENENPFLQNLKQFSGGAGRYQSYVSSLAKIILGKVAKADPPGGDDGYTSFLNVVIDYFHFSEFLRGEEIVKRYDFMSILHDFFDEYADTLSSAIDTACMFVFEGLPLYQVRGERGYERLAFDDPVFTYIYKKGEYFESGPTVHVPDWVDGLFFRDSDWEVHQAFFSGSGELLAGERDLRRNALRSRLGLPDATAASAQTKDVAADFTSEVHRLEVELHEANAKVTSMQAEVLKGKSRTTAMKLIGGLAMIGAELNIHSDKFDGITDVIRDLSLKGVDISDDTLREYLKEAASVIGKRVSK